MPCERVLPEPNELTFAVLRSAWSLSAVKAKAREDTSRFMGQVIVQTQPKSASSCVSYTRICVEQGQ